MSHINRNRKRTSQVDLNTPNSIHIVHVLNMNHVRYMSDIDSRPDLACPCFVGAMHCLKDKKYFDMRDTALIEFLGYYTNRILGIPFVISTK